MQSKTLSSEPTAAEKAPNAYFNAGLFRKNLSRFWPLWAVYFVAWFLMGPLTQFLGFFGRYAQMNELEDTVYNCTSALAVMASDGALVMAVIFGCLFAMALFSYLCSARSVGMMHAFPIRREGLFLTNYLSGLIVILATQAINTALIAAIWAAARVSAGSLLWQWFVIPVGELFFFYSFAVFCAMFTGQILALPVFYAALNGLCMGVNLLVQNLGSAFFYGYKGGSTPVWVIWLTPIYRLVRSVGYSNGLYGNVRVGNVTLYGADTVAVYAGAGLVLAALALAVYRRRKSETAGDTVTISWARYLFRYGVAACCALSLGQGLYYLVWEEFRGSQNDPSMPAMVICMVLLGLVGYYAAEMLLKKSFRVFRKSWKGAVAFSAVIVLLGVGVAFDVTGVEARVPDKDDVASVQFNFGGRTAGSGEVQDSETIQKFIDFHTAVLEEKDSQLVWQRASNSGGENVGQEGYLNFTYFLKNGSTISRNYFVYSPDDERSPAAARLAELVTEPTVQRANLLGSLERGRITSGELSVYTPALGSWDTISFDADEAQTIYEAVVQDVNAGNFGTTTLMDDETWADHVYVNGLTLYYVLEDGGEGRNHDRSQSICLSTSCVSTIAALKKTGKVMGEQLLTEQQVNGATGAYVENDPTLSTTAEEMTPETASAAVPETAVTAG